VTQTLLKMDPASLYNPTFPPAISKAWDGKVWVDMELKSADATTPDTLNWRAVMDKYATPDLPRDTFSQAGYLAASVVTQTLLKMDPAKTDRASVTAALRGVKRFESDMFCAAWYIGDGPRHNPNHTGPLSLLQGGKLVPIDTCIDSQDPELDDIHAYEKTIGISK
jgi:branched-chain amino acid transport system substrate-binding protein